MTFYQDSRKPSFDDNKLIRNFAYESRTKKTLNCIFSLCIKPSGKIFSRSLNTYCTKIKLCTYFQRRKCRNSDLNGGFAKWHLKVTCHFWHTSISTIYFKIFFWNHRKLAIVYRFILYLLEAHVQGWFLPGDSSQTTLTKRGR